MKIGFISDIHEDFVSLQKAIKVVKEQKLDAVACLGDITGFNARFYSYKNTKNAEECIKLISDNCKYVVPGNHDLNLLRRTTKFSCSFEFPENWFELSDEEKQKISDNTVWTYLDEVNPTITNTSLEYLSGLPEMDVISTQNHNMMISHYVYPDISGSFTGYVKSKDDLRQHFNLMRAKGCNIFITGHHHPDGILVGTDKRITLKDFGIYKLKNSYKWLGVPAIAGGKSHSGMMILDLKDNYIEVVKL